MFSFNKLVIISFITLFLSCEKESTNIELDQLSSSKSDHITNEGKLTGEAESVNYSLEQQRALLSNRLCSSSFVFTHVVHVDADGPGWKEASVAGLTVNTISDSYFESIWTTVTTGTPIVSSNFNLEIGVRGDRPPSQASVITAEAANLAMSNILKRWSFRDVKNMMQLGTFPRTFANEMIIQMRVYYPEARVSTTLSGRTRAKIPVTGC